MARATAKRRRVTFVLEAEPGSSVFVAGTFNAWSATKHSLKEQNGHYAASLLLPRGRHEYKFVINGDWCVDPQCSDWIPNNQGSLNSVMTIE